MRYFEMNLSETTPGVYTQPTLTLMVETAAELAAMMATK